MKNVKNSTFINIYILLWCIYELQFVFFGTDEGTIYSKLILLFLLTVSLYYFVISFRYYKDNQYIKALTLLFIMFTVYGSILIISNKAVYLPTGLKLRNFSYLQSIYISILPVFPFYVFTRRGLIETSNIRKWTILFVVIAGIRFFQNQYIQTAGDAIEITNNLGYAILSLLPLFSFFSKKRLIQYLGIAYIMLFLLLSMKRGAIIIGALCLAWFLSLSLKTTRRRGKFVVIVLSIAIIIAGYYYVLYMLGSSDYFNSRLDSTMEGNSSSRDILYGILWNHFIHENDFFHFIIGNGACATLSIAGNYAHNDWLEIAINHGVVGLIIYLSYWISFIKTTKQARYNDELYIALSMALIINFMKTLVSMSYTDMSLYSAICIGYCVGEIQNHKNNCLNSKDNYFVLNKNA